MSAVGSKASVKGHNQERQSHLTGATIVRRPEIPGYHSGLSNEWLRIHRTF